MRIAGRIYLLGVVVILFGGGLTAPEVDATADAQPKLLTELGASLRDASTVTRERANSDGLAKDGPLDFYGNEVTDAVMEYKLDAGGSLYETHSPQTELPHPASPRG